jgi:hypothetical protein
MRAPLLATLVAAANLALTPVLFAGVTSSVDVVHLDYEVEIPDPTQPLVTLRLRVVRPEAEISEPYELVMPERRRSTRPGANRPTAA